MGKNLHLPSIARNPSMRSRITAVALMSGLLILTVGCMEQYDPRRFWKQTKDERELAHRPLQKLTAKGEIPPMEAAVAEVDPVFAKYATMCASCHGEDGKGNGAASGGLVPKPRNFHDTAWQAKVDDAHLVKVLQKGGAAVGLSATMPAWGGVLTDEEINGLVKKIRLWGKK
jgi:mono/diheme cytochrome c family protein